MTNENTQKVVVAMSGGVDSSVAALLLKEQGYDVIGVTLRLFEPPQQENVPRFSRSCCSLEDVEDARQVCRLIGARHFYINLEKEFREHVINYFVSEYESGRTPHPCIACNDRIKFNFLMSRARLMGASLLATGHYARKVASDSGWGIARGVDLAKDQSYVLYNLNQEQLDRLLFPIGHYSKSEIRDIARHAGASVADKPDSQEICFIPYGNYKEFVESRIENFKPGRIIDQRGEELGRHTGIHRFTIGQHKGLPSVNRGGLAKRLYVNHINPATGDVTVGELASLSRQHAYASGVNWISGTSPTLPVRASIRIRYGGIMESGTIFSDGSWAMIKFDKPMRAVTPGQAIVFYDEQAMVLGGGFIEPSCPSEIQFSELAENLANAT